MSGNASELISVKHSAERQYQVEPTAGSDNCVVCRERPPSSSPPMSPAMGPLPPGGQVPRPGRGQVDPVLMASLPPEFVALLGEYGQLMDIDGDGTPDVAIVPLGNAMAQIARGGQ